MSSDKIRLHVQGPAAAETARDLADFLTTEFGTPPQIVTPTSDNNGRKIDPATAIALATLVLTIPGSILAVKDLSDRIKKKKKAEQLIRWAQEKQQSAPQIRIDVQIGQTIINLDQADSAQLLDALNK